jgi:hypothetical protein
MIEKRLIIEECDEEAFLIKEENGEWEISITINNDSTRLGYTEVRIPLRALLNLVGKNNLWYQVSSEIHHIKDLLVEPGVEGLCEGCKTLTKNYGYFCHNCLMKG